MSELLRSPKGKIGVGVASIVVVVMAAWFVLVSPQKAKATELDTQVSASRAELSQRRLALAQPSASVTVKPSDLYRLTKALPGSTDMAGILLDVNRLAGQNELEFNSIAPGAEVLGTGYVQQPLSVVVKGRFGDVSRFLGDVRTLVKVRKGRLDARGRLYSVSRVDITEPGDDKTFPMVRATVILNAYAFSTPPPAPPVQSTTADTSSNGTVAAGATP